MESDNTTSVSSLSTEFGGMIPNKKSRACTMGDHSLHHLSRLSKIRLDTSMDHIANIGKSSARCALHRWLGYETEKDVHFCPSCNANLCVRCNQIFHINPDILSMRDSLKNQYNK